MIGKIHIGSALDLLPAYAAAGVRVQTCVTSPPYFGLRDYGVDGQIGLESTPEQYVENLVQVFRLVRNVLADDGTVWLNIGDSYAGSGKGGNPADSSFRKQATNHGNLMLVGDTARQAAVTNITRRTKEIGLKPKNLIGIPWRLAFALQADGWFLRSEIVWAKPNCMPESVTDRPTCSHEKIFLLSKSERYYYDHEAIKEPAVYFGLEGQDDSGYKDAKKFAGKHHDKQRGHSRRHAGFNDRWDAMDKSEQCSGMRNKRNVWTVPVVGYSEAHFATFPPKLIEPCILAGAPIGGIVLDPFMGSGTTAQVSEALGRQWIGCDLNPAYAPMQKNRTLQRGLQLEAQST